MSTIKETFGDNAADSFVMLKLNFENYLEDVYIPFSNIVFPYEFISNPFDSAFFDYLAEDLKTFQDKLASLKLLEKNESGPDFINVSYEELLNTPVDEGADAANNISINTNSGEVTSQANDLSTQSGFIGSPNSYQLYTVEPKVISESSSSSFAAGSQFYLVNISSNGAEIPASFARFANFDVALDALKTSGDNQSLLDKFGRLGKVITLEGISDNPNGPFIGTKINPDGSPVPINLKDGDITLYGNGSFDFVGNNNIPTAVHFYILTHDGQGNQSVGEVFISQIQNQSYDAALNYNSILDLTTFNFSGSFLLGDAAAPGTVLTINSIENAFDSNVFDDFSSLLTLNDVLSNFDDSLTIHADGSFTFSGSAAGFVSTLDPNSLDFIVTDGQGNSVQATADFNFIPLNLTPVVFDFAGDGVNLVSPQDSPITIGALTGSLNTDHIGWIGNDDGILMYDPKGHGELTSLSQIAFASYVPGAKTDLEGLNAFDSNHDGVLDSHDTSYNDFGVLFADGQYETLEQLGIVSVSLESNHQLSIQDGNTIYGESTYQTSSGETLTIADVGLGVSVAASLSSDTPVVPILAANEVSHVDEQAQQAQLQVSHLG